MDKVKNVHITKSSVEPIIIDDDLKELTITIARNQKATIYQLNIKSLEKLTIRVESAGELDYLAYLNDETTKLKVEAKVEREGNLSLYTMATSDKNVSIEPRIELLAEEADVELLNVFLFEKDAIANSNVHIYHHAKATNSVITSYAIAMDNANIKINNNSTIVKGASLSHAEQIAKGLNLSPTSVIDANPNLFIDENDVNAHHGAAIGSLNKDDLFYLMSRGLSEMEAARIVVLGFLQPLLDKIHDEGIKLVIKTNFESKLK